MINNVNGNIAPAAQPVQKQKSSALSELVMVVALSAIALVAAHSCDYDAPGLALLLRCVPIGLTLIWLFRHFVVGHVYTSSQPPTVTVIHTTPQPVQHTTWWPNWFNRQHYVAPVTRNHMPMPTQHVVQPIASFPVVQPAPAQPVVFQQPAQFTRTVPVVAQPAQFTRTTPVVVQSAPLIQTMPAAVPAFPAVQPMPAQAFSRATVQQPTVHVPTQPLAPPAAAQSGSFPAVRAAPANAPVSKPQQAVATDVTPSTGRVHFAAATHR